jgi:rhodanese-related sulfurtransferase
MRVGLVVILVVLLNCPAHAVEKLSPRQAHAAAKSGDMILVDIRRPDEWATTGVAKGALRIDMLSGDFKARVAALRASNPDSKIGLICQAGVRSARMSQLLEDAGLAGLVDIAGGTEEWIEQGLPIER